MPRLAATRRALAWLLALSCLAALATGQSALAARGDAGARRVVRTQSTTVWAQYGRAESCFAQRSAPCVSSSTFMLYAAAVQARSSVGALLSRPLSATVRTGVQRYAAALDMQVRLSFQLYQAGLSRYIARIEQAMMSMRASFRDTDPAVALVLGST